MVSHAGLFLMLDVDAGGFQECLNHTVHVCPYLEVECRTQPDNLHCISVDILSTVM